MLFFDIQQCQGIGFDLTPDEVSHLIYAYCLRHRATRDGITDLLNLLSIILPPALKQCIPASQYLLLKTLDADFTQVLKCFYCKICHNQIQTMESEACPSCNAAVNMVDLIRSDNFFIIFDMAKSLQTVLSIKKVGTNLMENLAKRKSRESGVLRDIMDGACYKDLLLKDCEITCTINTDGVTPFKSSHNSIWPIFLSINELDYKLRRKHTMLVGMWFAKSKPSFDTFLKPFINACNKLTLDGFEWTYNDTIIKSQVLFPMVAADSPARCCLQGLRQYNGAHSCPWCLIRGENCTLEGGSHKWVFIPNKSPMVKRTHESFLSDVRMLNHQVSVRGDGSYNGVINASKFMLLQDFDMVDGFVFDYMHTTLLGVLKTYTNMLFDSSNHTRDFYLDKGASIAISKLLLRCKVPYETQRAVRDISDIKNWKAHEWKTWMVICIPILKEFLPLKYIDHLARFVLAFNILLADTITIEEASFAENLLQQFCLEAHAYFGPQFCTFNMHLLLHAADCVRNWGPLWSYSLFQFENANGVLTRLFNGTSKICMQIVNKVVITQQVRSIGESFFKHVEANDFFNSLVDKKTYHKKAKKCGNVTLIGAKRSYTLQPPEVKILQELNHKDILEAWSFKYFIVNGVQFCVSALDKKTCNSIMCVHGELYRASKIILLTSKAGEIPMVFGHRMVHEPYQYCKSNFKVVRVSKRVEIFACRSVTPVKYCTMLDDNGQPAIITGMLNSQEFE